MGIDDTIDGLTTGGMGVSSEREGATGPGQHGTDGVRDTSLPAEPLPDVPEGDEPPEQRPGLPEQNPDGQPPKAGYSSVDPRS